MAKKMALSKREKSKIKKEERECLKILMALFKLRHKIQHHIKKNKVGGAVFPILLNHDLNMLIINLKETYPDMKPLIMKSCQKIFKKQKSRT